MRNVLGIVVEKIQTRILCTETFFQKPCRLSDNIEKWGETKGATNDVNMAHTSCMLDKKGYTHSRALTHTEKYVVLIAFSRQLWRERASVLHYTYIACLLCTRHVVWLLVYRFAKAVITLPVVIIETSVDCDKAEQQNKSWLTNII
jgi:hypothetical protein